MKKKQPQKGLLEILSNRIPGNKHDKEFYFVFLYIKASIHSDDVIVMNLHALNNIILKYTKQTDLRCH